jgi:hypothetical protein
MLWDSMLWDNVSSEGKSMKRIRDGVVRTLRFYLLPNDILGWLLLLAVLTMLGCQSKSEPPKAEVSGNVTLDGKPMAEGDITFVTVAEGVRETLPVKDGKFTGMVQIGERQVEIRGYRQSQAATAMYGPGAEPSMENYLPERYNAKTTLKASVTPEGPNTFDFKVTEK